jgi:cyclopropane fatty-acyl-phospholipid synthase-like methyltransferase
MNWFDEWFNSKYYLRVYSHRDESEAQRLVELIIRKLNLKNTTSVLDMACGAGRHAINFAKSGFDTTAVDLSQLLISEARANALKSDVKIKFSYSDILKFNTEVRFDLAVNLFTSIGYFDSDEQNVTIIKKAYSLLKDNGYFVIDYFNKQFLINHLIPTTVFSEDGIKIIQNRSIENGRVVKKIIIEKNGSTENFYESVRLFSEFEVSSFITESGFTIINTFGDYYGNIYNAETSPRLIIFAKK